MKIKLSVSGDIGSFSEEAALLYAKQAEWDVSLSYLIDIQSALEAVEKGEVDYGIFPVVNMHGGLVQPAFAAMGMHSFTLIDNFWHQVNQCLHVMPGVAAPHITKIVSHAQGLAQCKQYLQAKFRGVDVVEWSNTARAARDLAEGNLPPGTAVIAPERCSQIYGLTLLDKNIQDGNPNLTAFIIVKRRGNDAHD